jgi:glycosyltransferase involved in cell wall biosynthesis
MFDLGIASRPLVPFRYAISAVRTAAYLVRRRPTALLVTHPPVFPGLIGLAYSRWTKTPIVLDSHPNAFGEKSNRIGRLLLPLHRWLAQHVDLVIVGVDVLCHRVEEWGGQALVVHEAPPIGELPPRSRSTGRPNVLWIGIFAADEPVSALMDAAALSPDIDFVVTGDLRKLPLDPRRAPRNVHFSGYLRGALYRQALADADAVLALTDDRTSALRAASEATYARKPLVVSDLPHLAELFPHAIRVPNDGPGIAAGVAEALERSDDTAEARELALVRERSKWDRQQAALLRALRLSPENGDTPGQ